MALRVQSPRGALFFDLVAFYKLSGTSYHENDLRRLKCKLLKKNIIMKPIYKSLELTAMTLQVSVTLNAETYNGTTTSETALPADVLDSLRVELVETNVSGARDLIKSGECTVSDNSLSIDLQTGGWIKGGVYRLQVIATFGTQTEVIYALDVTVPRYDALASEPQEYEDTVVVVSTVGDGSGVQITVDQEVIEDSINPVAGGAVFNALADKADASVYALDGDGNAHITLPLNVSGSVSEGSPYSEEIYELNVVVLTPEQKEEVEEETGTAYNYLDTNDEIPDGSNVTIYSDEECTQKVGSTAETQYISFSTINGDLFNLQEGESLSAGTYYARVERGTLGPNSHAEGVGTTASGSYSHAEGVRTTASGYSSHAEGVGTTASDVSSHAEGARTTASGSYSHAEGEGTTASGYSSHAEGQGTIASQANQHVCGQYNVEDTDNSFQFIVGNGTDSANRRNAFAVTKSGELALFEADGTPVILDAATLKALIASVANA